ncbi:alpha-2,8-polysialyltransferase family protein [Pseudomonas sp. PS1]|uniref:Alpha-2,8-polysialyltransferase family protein n=1 Tax=Stutzerimonas marianensis TaxID=2929513 RepID=A0A9X2AQM2_9GAMM|nr:alpha-2,8-polysialyltransferase family protein [Pseudomonas marianensis]MCJ0972453.1 alpha-2,8-polysialyltransferase family protein [Pseudomonas marianensis]
MIGSSKKICVVLSMHQLIIVLSVLKAKQLGRNYFDCVLLREGAHYPELISRIFTGADIYVVKKIEAKGVWGRIAEIKRLGDNAVESLRLKGAKIEIWIPNKTYHITNFILYHASVGKTVAYEDGLGSYIDSGLLERKAGFRTLAKKILAVVGLFPVYRSFFGVSKIKANEYWALGKSAFSGKGVNLISTDDYISALTSILTLVSRDSLPNITEFSTKGNVVVVGQPLAEVGLCSVQESISKFRRLGQAFIASLGSQKEVCKVIYLPHPTERPDLAEKRLEAFTESGRYSCVSCVYENKNSIEIMLAHLALSGVEVILVGSSSTALYSASISNICTESYFCADSNDLNVEEQRAIFNRFGVKPIDL